uniref:Transposase n=1 Tax=Roseihalotalea indica TaxID=2867963 RepID=A0AA49GIZ6_9BACT|nr:transposase [Tunicatimonas sp. TK19036]
MQVKEILREIPKDLTDKLPNDVHLNERIHYLRGRVLLNLLLFGSMRSEHASIIILKVLYNAPLFNATNRQSDSDKTYGACRQNRDLSAGKPLYTVNKYMETIPPEHLKDILDWAIQHSFEGCEDYQLAEKVERFNAAIIKTSGSLIKWSMPTESEEYANELRIKISLGLDGLLAGVTQTGLKRNRLQKRTLKKILMQGRFDAGETVTIEREFICPTTSKKSSGELVNFVACRAKTLHYHIINESSKLPLERDGILFLQDSKVYFHADGGSFNEPFRLVEILDISQGKRLYFISDIFDLSAETIVDIYRHRWDIRGLFRYLKHELDINYWLSRSFNGIEVQLYVSLLSAILLSVFKTKNQIKGAMTSKFMFQQQLLRHILVQLKSGKRLIDEEDYKIVNNAD